MTITARCHPALRGILPEPVMASRALPDWLKDMPSEAPAAALGGASVRTLKHCAPMIDAMSAGILLPLAADLVVSAEGLSWDWSPPVIPDQGLNRAPVGLHVPEQAMGAPLPLNGRAAIKFMNFWTLEAPAGWSILFTHPLNREDLPFRTLSGIVDCDLFSQGYVHFPVIWVDDGFRGTLPAGTPVAQAIAVPRDGAGLEIGVLDAGGEAGTRDVQLALARERGVYRKQFRGKR